MILNSEGEWTVSDFVDFAIELGFEKQLLQKLDLPEDFDLNDGEGFEKALIKLSGKYACDEDIILEILEEDSNYYTIRYDDYNTGAWIINKQEERWKE
jgi:hypothetical protein